MEGHGFGMGKHKGGDTKLLKILLIDENVKNEVKSICRVSNKLFKSTTLSYSIDCDNRNQHFLPPAFSLI